MKFDFSFYFIAKKGPVRSDQCSFSRIWWSTTREYHSS